MTQLPELPDIQFKHVWILTGPLSTIMLLFVAYRKYRHSGSVLNRYDSNDMCIFFHIWTHALGNFAFAIVNFPLMDDVISCTVRKWVVLWIEAMTIFSNLPILLDFCLRTSSTEFYQVMPIPVFKLPGNPLMTIYANKFAPLNVFPQAIIGRKLLNAKLSFELQVLRSLAETHSTQTLRCTDL